MTALNPHPPLPSAEALGIAGLAFRTFRGEVDYPLMLEVIEESKKADRAEWSTSVEDIARDYSHLRNCDPKTDMIFALIDGRPIGYGRTGWEDERKGDRILFLFVNLVPAWRGKGIRAAMVRWLEDRARAVAEANPTNKTKIYQTWMSEHEQDAIRVFTEAGYEPARWEYEMIRSLDEPIADAPLPEGIELRPVTDADAPQVFAAANEAFIDHWGETDWFTPKSLDEWRKGPTYDPSIWKIAFDGDEVVGTVMNYVHKKENQEYGRQRGYTESICVRKAWRGRGIAKALITESMRMHKAMGMTEVCHGVDTQNPTGALQLYEGLGYRPHKREYAYRKPMRTG